METDYGLVKSGITHCLLLETDFGSMENGMIHSRAFLISSWFNRSEQSSEVTGMVQIFRQFDR